MKYKTIIRKSGNSWVVLIPSHKLKYENDLDLNEPVEIQIKNIDDKASISLNTIDFYHDHDHNGRYAAIC